MIFRTLSDKLKYFAKLYPVISVTGPRQSGKTTLVKQTFANYKYFNLEDVDIRNFAITDPKGFLGNAGDGMIIDEIQRVPELFSYIQNIVDKADKTGQFIITGSQNFLLMEGITQTLAGRIAIIKLLPFSNIELKKASLISDNFKNQIFKGGYPRLYDKDIPPKDFYPFYIQTYIERDVKQIRNISNQNTFIRFIKMCAGRVGQLLNITDLANSCGITQVTAKSWLSILEASYIIYFLQPHYKNFNKRLVKMPKMYFNDTGLVCSLLGIKDKNQVQPHYLYGALFENFIINEFQKFYYNKVTEPELYFWRDKNGKEIDLIIETNGKLIPVEIKAGETFVNDYFKNLRYWNKLSGNSADNSFIIYGGNNNLKTSNGKLFSWLNISDITDKINVL
jgi:predicted AAA+ superfamily ATPase